MSVVRRNGRWVVPLVLTASLAYSVGLMAQKQAPLTVPGNADSATLAAPIGKEANGRAQAGVAGANELSAAFRRVAREALPGIVSVEVRGRAATSNVQGQGELPFGDDSPFGQLFKNDPRFRELFRNPRGSAVPRTQGMGSGFVIDPSGIILTNNHVVQNADQVKVKLQDGREFLATEVKTDPRSDVAIIRVATDEKLPALRLGDSDSMEIGDWVLAVGSPFGLDLTVTAGIISAKGRGPGIAEREDFLQTDAAINPGNSGGPLLNLDGEVIGINTAISTRSGGYDGVGFAVPINMARWVSDQLVSHGTVQRAYLGVAIQPVTNDLAKQFNVPVGRGALVTQVMPDSPAADAKLETGDLILQLDGKDVNGPRTLQGIVEQLTVGKKSSLLVQRNGKEVTLTIEARAMPQEYTAARSSSESDTPESNRPAPSEFEDLGLGIEQLTPDVARQLGYKEASGVLISSVKDDSPAAAAGLREGLIIEKVGNQRVNTPAEFRDALSDLSVEKGILLLVRSPRGTQFVVIRQTREATLR